MLPDMSPALPGFSPALPGPPKLVIGAPSYSEGRQECPPRVWYSPEIDASMLTLHILSDTPGGFQWLKYILLMMPSHSPHTDMTPVIRNVQTLPKLRMEKMRGPSGSSQLPPAKRHSSVQAGVRYSSHRGSSIASTIQDQNSTPSSALNNCSVADMPQCVTSTPSAIQRQVIHTPTATLGTRCRSTLAPGGSLQTDSTHRIVSSPASGIPCNATPLITLEIQATPIPHPEARTIITNPLQTQAAKKIQRQRQWELQLQTVSTRWLLVSGCCSTYWFGGQGIMRLLFAIGRLLERFKWNTQLYMSASDLEMVGHVMNYQDVHTGR